MRLELKPFGIDVIVGEPGIIITDFGNVLEGPLQKYSGKGAYADLASKVARATAQAYETSDGCPPEVVAESISCALKASRPRTRYAVGKYARLLIGIRNWLGDRFYDRLIMGRLR